MTPKLIAHYMPWFEADPAQRRWGWHWRMNAFDPERQKDGRRELASHYYPLIGPYDSGDPAVLEYHLLLMKLAGIDGVMVDWYGLSDLYDYPILQRNTQALLAVVRRLGLTLGICYEDQTVTQLVAAKRLAPEKKVEHVRRELLWLQENWFGRPEYLQLEGKPVLLSFGYGGLSDTEWGEVLQTPGLDCRYFSEHRARPAAFGAFDWPQPALGTAGVATFASANPNPLRTIPVAFPRFDDCYKEGKAQDSYRRIPDADGRTFTDTLRRALASGAPLLQLATWNDWGEGTQLEPSREFGYRDLEVLQRFRKRGRAGDLRLPLRLYEHRRSNASAAALDRVAATLAKGDVATAQHLLDTLPR